MKALMISGDKNVLKTGTEAQARLALQASVVEQLDAFVWPQVQSAWRVWRAARTNRYDVVTTQDPFWRGLLGYKIKFWLGAKLNVQVHADLAGQSFSRRALARFVLRRADSVRVPSERIAAEVRELGVKAPVHVLPVFIDPARITGTPHAPHPHFAKTILWVGRFEDEKDPMLALEVVRQVRAVGADVGLVMLGTGSLEAELKRTAQGLPVEFPGWQSPAPYLAMADVVLSTSPYESYGASIVEALAAQVPVVSRDVGVAREAGAIIAPREGLAQAVVETLRSKPRSELRLPLLGAKEWAAAWRKTLI